MSTFESYSAVKKLHQFAKNPIDLSQKGVLTPERIEKFAVRALGFTLLFAAERIDKEIYSTLLELAKEAHALEKMKQMQSGEVINAIEGVESENRMVLHTAMRDLFDNRQTALVAKNAAEAAEIELEKLNQFLNQNNDRFTDLIQIGIGGSDLGPRALCMALEAYHLPNRKIHFISNVDPDDANLVLSRVDLKKTLVVVVSKSGSTLETLTNEEFVRARMKQAGINPKEHFVAV